MGDVQPTESTVEVEETLFDRVGGHATFRTLIHVFFDGVKGDPELAALYPQNDWDGAENRLLLFFEQYWGGPMTYSRTRGAPMLKMRHMPHKITERMARKWATCMQRAIDTIDIGLEDELLLRDYVERACQYLINADEAPPSQ
ncbi:globin [Propioniciclava sinopodophylli]|uniref:Globin n=1 Tax=Propioniciclava sinopodophylli TaxID=1837344 RepID=A0A4Q9KB01_9ACTN|nr:globin [Propioniciclava sinopodophylli]